MSARVLVAYATKHGSTEGAAEAIAPALRERGTQVDIRSARKVTDLSIYSLVVLGAPLYSGRWHRDAHRFLKSNQEALSRLPVAVFALGPRSPQVEGGWPRCQAQLDRALARHSWLTPVGVELFGGADPPKKNRDRRDQRDWTAIREWAVSLAVR